MGKRLTLSLISLVLLLVFPAFSLSAQEDDTRDYRIVSLSSELVVIEENTFIRVTIVVENAGSDAESPADVVITLQADEPDILVQDSLLPLSGGSSVTLEIPFSVELFPGDSQQTLEISIGVDDIEEAGTDIASDNVDTITFDIPARESETIALFERTDTSIIVYGEEIPLTDVALWALASVGILMLLWILAILFRAIFSRPPRFGAWQPPYGVMPMYDQNTVEGRRWGWQQLAQNGLLLAPPTDGNIHPVKLLTSTDGRNLDNWKVTAMRLSQYDVYGRIARTQVLADKKSVRRMNNVLKKRLSVDESKRQKMLRPIADAMVKQFVKKVSKKTAFLPIAFDIRWQGKHGDVRIIFELYQFAENAWYRIDRWDPMMQVVSRSMQENYTFTIHGKESVEKMREFRERLRDDVIWLLLESFRVEAVEQEQTGEQPPVRQQYDVPDTLSGMDPIQPQEQELPPKQGA